MLAPARSVVARCPMRPKQHACQPQHAHAPTHPPTPPPRHQVDGLAEVAGRKHKCTLSDGAATVRGILATQFAEQVASGAISNGALVKVNAFVMNTVGNEDVLMATDLEVVAPGRGAAPMDVDAALGAHNVAPSASATPVAAVKEPAQQQQLSRGGPAGGLLSAAVVKLEKENSTPAPGPHDE